MPGITRTGEVRHGRVAVVYHFFAHYRGAVLRELLEHGRHEYFLVGDVKDPAPTGILPWDGAESSRFERAPARFLPGGIMVQRGLLRLALRRDVKAIIYLGDPHYATTWVSAVLARLSGKRVLFWTIGWHRDEHGMKDFLRRAFLRCANDLLLYGHYAKMQGLKRGFAPERMHVVYNSLDVDQQRRAAVAVPAGRAASVRQELFSDPGLPMLICVSRLVPKRRLDLLLDALVLLRREGFPANLLLVGEGPERVRLERMAQENDLSVKFFGECYDETVLAELLLAADATVAPGMVGLAAMQSLAYGTPVVTHDDPDRQAPEWEAIVPGQGGVFFRFGDSADLARAIRECLALLGRDSLARRYAGAIIDRFYNPAYQRRVIDRAVAGEPADDLLWMRERAKA